MKRERNEKSEKTEKMVSITPLKDFRIVQNDVDIFLKAGKEAQVPERFIENLLTEGLITKEVI